MFDLGADGGLTDGRVFAAVSHGETTGGPDGMKLDTQGNLYVMANTAEGVWLYVPDRTLLDFIGVPEPPALTSWRKVEHPDDPSLELTLDPATSSAWQTRAGTNIAAIAGVARRRASRPAEQRREHSHGR